MVLARCGLLKAVPLELRGVIRRIPVPVRRRSRDRGFPVPAEVSITFFGGTDRLTEKIRRLRSNCLHSPVKILYAVCPYGWTQVGGLFGKVSGKVHSICRHWDPTLVALACRRRGSKRVVMVLAFVRIK